jgi:hypothetical protein
VLVFQCWDYQLSITQNVSSCVVNYPQIPTCRPSGFTYGLIITIGSTITGVGTSTIFWYQSGGRIFLFIIELSTFEFHQIQSSWNRSVIKWKQNLLYQYKYKIDTNINTLCRLIPMQAIFRQYPSWAKLLRCDNTLCPFSTHKCHPVQIQIQHEYKYRLTTPCH